MTRTLNFWLNFITQEYPLANNLVGKKYSYPNRYEGRAVRTEKLEHVLICDTQRDRDHREIREEVLALRTMLQPPTTGEHSAHVAQGRGYNNDYES